MCYFSDLDDFPFDHRIQQIPFVKKDEPCHLQYQRRFSIIFDG